MSISLSLDISKLDEKTLSEFVTCQEFITTPKTTTLNWAGRNPVFVQFLSTRSRQDKKKGVLGRYCRRQVTIFTCQSYSTMMATVVHEYAHHLQYLNYKAENDGWCQTSVYQNHEQDTLFRKWCHKVPEGLYMTDAPHEMAAEAFTVVQGYKLDGWDVPVEFFMDWCLFFNSQPYFKETLKRE